MKKILILLFCLAAFAKATVPYPDRDFTGGKSIGLLGATPGAEPAPIEWISMDALENDTSKYHYQLLNKPVVTFNDTIGFVHFACKDFAGTDTLAVKLKWQGNSRADGASVWANMDSVTLKDLAANGNAAYGVLTNATPTAVVNSKGYAAIRFILTNILPTNATQKAACQTPILNIPLRVGAIR
jgi:hypothetical protein